MAQVAQRLVNFGTRVGTKAVQFGTPKAQTFWRYAKVELRPPTLTEMPKISEGVMKVVRAPMTGSWKNLTVKEAFLNTLVAVEVGCWFFIGEVIGRGSIIGYSIPGAVHYDAVI